MRHKTILFLFSILFPLTLLAHGSHGNGIMAGFTHPILGIDHAIAILGVGFLSFLINNSKWYLMLLTFIITMIIGGFIGIDKEATLIIEKIIAASVLIIGLFILFFKRINTNIILIGIAAFGFFHGFAHGAEMPESSNSLIYVAGYSLGTLLMGTIGMFISKYINSKTNFEQNIHLVSGVMVGCGLIIILT